MFDEFGVFNLAELLELSGNSVNKDHKRMFYKFGVVLPIQTA